MFLKTVFSIKLCKILVFVLGVKPDGVQQFGLPKIEEKNNKNKK